MAYRRDEHQRTMSYLANALSRARTRARDGEGNPPAIEQNAEELLRSAKDCYSAGDRGRGQDLLLRAEEVFAEQLEAQYLALDHQVNQFHREVVDLAYGGSGQGLDGKGKDIGSVALVTRLGRADSGRAVWVDLREMGNLAIWSLGRMMFARPIAESLMVAFSSENAPGNVQFVAIGTHPWVHGQALAWATPPASIFRDDLSLKASLGWLTRTLDHRLQSNDKSFEPIVVLVDQDARLDDPRSPAGMVEGLMRVSREGPAVAMHLLATSSKFVPDRVALLEGADFWTIIVDDERSWLLDKRGVATFLSKVESLDSSSDVRSFMDALGDGFETPSGPGHNVRRLKAHRDW